VDGDASAAMTVLRVERLGPIVERSELTLRPGMLLLLYGRPGTGKSYTMRLLYAASRIAERLSHYTLEWRIDAEKLVAGLLSASLSEVYAPDADRILSEARFELAGDGVVVRWVEGAPSVELDEERLKRHYSRISSQDDYLRSIEECTLEVPEEMRAFCEHYNNAVAYVAAVAEALFDAGLSHCFHSVASYVEATPSSMYVAHGRSLLALLYELAGEKPVTLSELLSAMRSRPPFSALYEPVLLALEREMGGTSSLMERVHSVDRLLGVFVHALLLGGDVERRKTRRGSTELIYRADGTELHMLNTSAAIPEVLTLVAAILHAIRGARDNRGLLFIEEPETQLHPVLQRLAAWLLLYLAGLGYTVVASTHSSIIAVEALLARRAARVGCSTVSEVAPLGVLRDGGLACKLRDAVLSARVSIVYFEDGRFREYGEEPPGGVPGITDVLEEQLRALEVIGAAEEMLESEQR